MIKQLVILAGGKGLRLGLTDIPKLMVDIAVAVVIISGRACKALWC
ncbi:hypothetical protein AGMMS49921_03510 [Endomicrobiia bacterium]|nr:hypothetical protein AGMMS49921_03510 [Endomicrobiia bacterium]